jgi:hypothetical protein
MLEEPRRLREAAPGRRVEMRCDDVFKGADVINLDERRAAQRGPAVRKKADGGEPAQRPRRPRWRLIFLRFLAANATSRARRASRWHAFTARHCNKEITAL